MNRNVESYTFRSCVVAQSYSKTQRNESRVAERRVLLLPSWTDVLIQQYVMWSWNSWYFIFLENVITFIVVSIDVNWVFAEYILNSDQVIIRTSNIWMKGLCRANDKIFGVIRWYSPQLCNTSISRHCKFSKYMPWSMTSSESLLRGFNNRHYSGSRNIYGASKRVGDIPRKRIKVIGKIINVILQFIISSISMQTSG